MRAPLAATLVLLATSALAQVTVGGVVDVRAVRTDEVSGWLDEGLGKTRYGAPHGRRGTLFRLSRLALLVKAEPSETLSAHVHLDVDAEPEPDAERGRVGLVEGYLAWSPDFAPDVRLRARAGMFFPPVSLENSGPAWTSRYAITPSAIDAWIGEEVRPTGIEAALVLGRDRGKVTLTGAAFGGNDPAGSLLGWRGWALHDKWGTTAQFFPFAPIPAIEEGGAFADQADWVQPVREIDGRLGWYGGASASWPGAGEIRGLYYDNRGRETDFDGYQYAWKTRFTAAGARLPLPGGFEILGQFMDGTTAMGRLPSGALAVDAPFRAAYGMLTWSTGRHRLTARYDDFRVEDRDELRVEDDNTDHGRAWLGAYMLKVGEAHRIALEVLRVESDHGERAALGLDVHADEIQVQASVQLVF